MFCCCDCDLAIGRILWVVGCWSSLAALVDDVDDEDGIGSIDGESKSHCCTLPNAVILSVSIAVRLA